MLMALKNDVDKAKFRTAVKLFLRFKGEATARQISNFINECDLKIRGEVNPSVVAKDLMYCSTQPKNFLNVKSYRDRTNHMRYYLED